ncbi:Beta-hexosaminidase [termite gut metagenome]|uniref:beta-N-acetylhexosaminidase n=1 Tax=termite gut metagenome TaxID=433724 RepID=A0A5J4QT55_9ZZZZ
MKNFLLTLLTFFFFLACNNQKDLGEPLPVEIIPKPISISEVVENHEVSKSANIYVHNENAELFGIAEYLKGRMDASIKGSNVQIKEGASTKKGIHLILNKNFDEKLGDEGYIFSSKENVVITANYPAGVFNGVQTFFQLLPVEIYGNNPKEVDLIIPAVEITDKPRYAYRGMHLDPCRHFFTVETTKNYLDYMAYHKLNNFHWHLTEDQGWRIEIKKYPKLIEVGSKRGGTIIMNHDVSWNDEKYDNIPVEGYYTQKEIKEVVQYAKERFIEVIPEIEMPGHALAALASYPQLSCTGGPFEVRQKPGVSENVYCAGNDSVFVFLQDVIDEVVTMFPSKYIHIGGDECPKKRWETCSKCQKVIKEEGLTDEHELQSWFITKMEKHINSKGKTLIGWSEIMEGGIAPNAVLQSWIGTTAGIQAAKQKHQAIMSPYSHLYFDGIYVDRAHRKMEPFGQTYCWTNSEKVYSFDPTPDTLPVEYHPYFIGAEATMWSEFIKTEEHLEYLLMPRVSALSEICWTQKEQKDFADFHNRLDRQYLRYDELGVNYRIPHPVMADTMRISVGDEIMIGNPTEITEVRYTLNGKEPSITSDLYSTPIPLADDTVIKAAGFHPNGRKSSIAKTVVIIK